MGIICILRGLEVSLGAAVSLGFRVWGSGFRAGVQGLGFRFRGFDSQGSEFRV